MPFNVNKFIFGDKRKRKQRKQQILTHGQLQWAKRAKKWLHFLHPIITFAKKNSPKADIRTITGNHSIIGLAIIIKRNIYYYGNIKKNISDITW